MSTSYKELIYYGRYRDDILALWCGTENKLNEFYSYLNTINSDLKFTMEIGRKEICFLDLKISFSSSNKLETEVYSKPTDSHLYLHANSCHNKASVNGIAKGVALRLRRICSTEESFERKETEYTKYLTDRGHNKKNVNKSFKNVKNISRQNARKNNSDKSNIPCVVFTSKFNPRGPDVNKITRRNLKIIENHPELNRIFPKDSIIVANKRERNLKELMLRGDPYNIKIDVLDKDDHSYKKCNKKCDSCQNYVEETSFVTSKATGRKFKIHRDSSCQSKNVIYIAFCLVSGKQGVET